MNAGKTMYSYHEWAMSTMLDHLNELPKEVIKKEIKSSYPTIAKTLSHILAVDTMWIQILKKADFQHALEEAMTQLPTTDAYTVDEFKVAFKELALQYQTFMYENLISL
ncbi:DinB family protein [Exiguobacterium sp. R-39]|uniref:DinB family protein n=1 Tax=Exiguobacterium sp. R-39 TaxID=3416708 RepID=UPI003CF4D306